jgi:hypothetical protein
VSRENAFEMLLQSIQDRQLYFSHLCFNTKILEGLEQRKWNVVAEEVISNPAISISSLFLENDSQTKLKHAIRLIKYSTVPYPFVSPLKKKQYLIMSRKFTESLCDSQLHEDQVLLSTAVCESGRVDLIRYLHAKGVSFNNVQNNPLFQAVVFGHPEAVQVLLYEVGVNVDIYSGGRRIIFLILIIDHVLLSLATATSFLSFVNEFVCRQLNLGGPSIMLFGFHDSSRWCVPDLSTENSPYTSLVVFSFFFLLYLGLSQLVVSIRPLVSCIVKVFLKSRRDRLVNPSMVDLERFHSNNTIVNL